MLFTNNRYVFIVKRVLKKDRRTYLVMDHWKLTGGPGSPTPVGPGGPGLP